MILQVVFVKRSLRGYQCGHVTSMEARRGQHFSYSSICQFTQWCALVTHNRTNRREKDTQWSHLRVVVAECELMTTRIVSHRIGKHAHPFETIQTPGEISPKTHLMGAKIGTKMGTFTRRAGCPKRARGYKIVRGNQPLFLLFFFPGHLLYPITVRNEWSMVVNLDVL